MTPPPLARARARTPLSFTSSPSTGVHIPRATPQITLLSRSPQGAGSYRHRADACAVEMRRCSLGKGASPPHAEPGTASYRGRRANQHRAPYTLTKQRAYPTGSLPARGFGVPTTYIGMSRGQRNSLAHRVSVPRDIAGRLSGRDKCPNTLAANHGCWSLRLLQLPHGNWKAVSFVLPFHEFTNLRICGARPP